MPDPTNSVTSDQHSNTFLTLFWNTPKLIWAFIVAICTASMAYALYTQYFLGLVPCNFCMLQRGSMIAVGVIALIALIHNPTEKPGRLLYASLADLAAISGIIFAGRHVWLQHLPEDQVPACGPSFDYLVSQFPMTEVIQEIFSGSGDCAEIQWQFLGFSMPECVLAIFILLTLCCYRQTFLAFKK
jgi:disulfide bond formation protein DsbB